jgi:hypothetical protein
MQGAAFPDLHPNISMATGQLCGLAWYIRKNESGVISYGARCSMGIYFRV